MSLLLTKIANPMPDKDLAKTIMGKTAYKTMHYEEKPDFTTISRRAMLWTMIHSV
jgi:hypothetical protein